MRRLFLLQIPLFFLLSCTPPINSVPVANGTARTADAALFELVAGNVRYVEGMARCTLRDAQRRKQTAEEGQHPSAMILSCADSRVPLEIIFDRGIGEIFVARVAGNVASTDELGTLEYGAEHLGIPLLVVLGHTKCGAVTAVFNGEPAENNLARLLQSVVPAVNAAKQKAAAERRTPTVDDAIRRNVQQALLDIRSGSPVLKRLEEEGKLKILGALYDIESGRVEWLPRAKGQE